MTKDEMKAECSAIRKLIGYEHAHVEQARVNYEATKTCSTRNIRLLHAERRELEEKLLQESEEEG